MPLIIRGQENGIKFDDHLDWNGILSKARAENKYIFVDCFATWCAPCKQMDKDVYTDENIGNYLNSHFISVKVQMDTSNVDNEVVKKWYRDAHRMMKHFSINAFPTYLFFAPNGQIVHRGLGYKSGDRFLVLVKQSTNPQKQYYTLKKVYEAGKLDYKKMEYLANTAKLLKDETVAAVVARDYINNYLLRKGENDLYTEKNLIFIASFLSGTKERGFDLFYHHSNKVDIIMGKGYSLRMVDYIITKEEVWPRLWKDDKSIKDTPEWNIIDSIIKKKYGVDYADRIVLDAKISWFNYQKNWDELAKCNVEKIEKYGLDTAGFGRVTTSDMIWNVIFLHTSDLNIINKGIGWMEEIIKISPDDAASLDTYANLLYKVGRRQDAIIWEGKAIKIDSAIASKNNVLPDKLYQETLEKMQRGIPTW